MTQIPFDNGLIHASAKHVPTGWWGTIHGLVGDADGTAVVAVFVLLDDFHDHPTLHRGRYATGNMIGPVPVEDIQLLSSGPSS